ncbi:MAG TPA: hypothetical protein VFB37_09950 [Steroidobacteraceae bacterium]|nr:hypothetical protein [Steroidobacteraceae bacterium]
MSSPERIAASVIAALAREPRWLNELDRARLDLQQRREERVRAEASLEAARRKEHETAVRLMKLTEEHL